MRGDLGVDGLHGVGQRVEARLAVPLQRREVLDDGVVLVPGGQRGQVRRQVDDRHLVEGAQADHLREQHRVGVVAALADVRVLPVDVLEDDVVRYLMP